MISMTDLFIVFFIHWFADFCLQTDKVAQGKSTSNLVLLKHVALYSVCFIGFGWKFALVNMGLHFITDWCSSRATSFLWKKGDRHNFFVVIGLDQMAHAFALIYTLSIPSLMW